MELSSVDYHYAPWVTFLILISMIWVVVVPTALSRSSRSAGPVAAVLVPLALFTAGVWTGSINTLRGMPITSETTLHASAAAGFADSFGLLYPGAILAVLVIICASLRRHRPFVDRVTATLFVVLLIELAVARYFIAHVDPAIWRYPDVLSAPVVALIVAVIAMIWTFLTGRGRVTSDAIPYGITMMLAIAAMAGVVVWQTVQQYRTIAMNG